MRNDVGFRAPKENIFNGPVGGREERISGSKPQSFFLVPFASILMSVEKGDAAAQGSDWIDDDVIRNWQVVSYNNTTTQTRSRFRRPHIVHQRDSVG
jgi:hypothetical protein